MDEIARVNEDAQKHGAVPRLSCGDGIFNDIGQQPQTEYTVSDDTVPRCRPKAFIAQTGDAGDTVSKNHALWECNRRIGRGNVVAVTASRWRGRALHAEHAGGTLNASTQADRRAKSLHRRSNLPVRHERLRMRLHAHADASLPA